jgi:hypothetical protein
MTRQDGKLNPNGLNRLDMFAKAQAVPHGVCGLIANFG